MNKENNLDLSSLKTINNLDKNSRVQLVFNETDKQLYVKKAISNSIIPIYKKIKKLDSDYFPKIYAIVPNGEYALVAEEYIFGMTLGKAIEQTGVMDLKTATNYIKEISTAVKLLHENDIIHRDLTENNVILTDSGKIKIIDFNISHPLNNKTKDTYIMGTPNYAAPEQFGFFRSDKRTDIYAVGVLYNFLLTGTPEPGTYKENLRAADIIAKCTRFDPENRYKDLNNVLIDLNSIDSIKGTLGKIEKLASKILVVIAVLLEFLATVGLLNSSSFTSRDFYVLILITGFLFSPIATFGNWFNWQKHTFLANKSRMERNGACALICLLIWFILLMIF